MFNILRSLAMIALVVSVVAGGTYAWQMQKEKVLGITYSAGSADLKIDSDPSPSVYKWEDGFSTEGFFNKSYLKPGDSGEQIVDIKNVGSSSGNAWVKLDLLANRENGVLSPEKEAGDGDENGQWDGELAENLRIKISYKKGEESSFVQKYDFTLAQYGANPNLLALGEIGSGGELDENGIGNVKFEWFIPSNAGNKIMTDSVDLDIIFGLN